MEAELMPDVKSTKTGRQKNKIVISFGFHHMDENGMYDGWTNHDLIIRPDFDGFKIKITGRDRNCVKDYLYELFFPRIAKGN